MFKKLAIVLLILSLSIASAQNCKEPQTTLEMKICASKDYEKIDKKLNRVYRELLKLLDSTGKKKLRNLQRAWIKYRDNKAEYDADSARGGTMQGLIYIGSKIDTTKKRILEIEEDIKRAK